MSISKNKLILILITLITLAGLSLRFHALGAMDIWTDEALTLYFSSMSAIDVLNLPTAIGEFNPPLFYLLEHYILQFGNSEFILRFIPALAGTITIPVVYLVGRELFDDEVGLVAALIFAFSGIHLMYSQEARAYTLAVLVTLVALYFAIKAYKSDKGNKYFILFGVASGIALWVHFYTFIFTGIIFLFLGCTFFFTQGYDYYYRLKRTLIGGIYFILVASPMLLVIASLFLTRTTSNIHFGDSGILVTIINGTTMFLGLHPLTTLVFTVLLVASLCSLVWFRWYAYNDTALYIRMLPIFLFAGSIIASGVLSLWMPMMPRYYLFVLPMICISIATITYPLKMIPKWRNILTVVLCLVIIGSSLPSITAYYDSTKEDWSGIASDVRTYAHAGDAVVCVPEYLNFTLGYYYDPIPDGVNLYTTRNVSRIQQIIQQTSQNGKQTYIVVSHLINIEDPTGKTYAWIYDNTDHLSARETNIYLYRINSSMPEYHRD
jgi:mannosyltransferase